MHVQAVPCYRDNYAYLITLPGRSEVAVVDASEAGPVLAALGERRPVAILSTHHHYDHVNGNSELAQHFPGLEVFGHADEARSGHRIPAQNRGLADGEEFTVLGARGVALHIPGHTRTAVAFYFAEAGVLFTGDTLFGAGCGRLFEGTPADMHASLSRLAALPGDTRVYSGHEYTENNLNFAAEVEPQSAALKARREAVRAQRRRGEPTVPSTMHEERDTNPFLRTDIEAVRRAVAGRPPVAHAELDGAEVLARLRAWKDTF
ncbi:MAG: hydroxyacylglutathione hydrolase [Polyangia bacterium]